MLISFSRRAVCLLAAAVPLLAGSTAAQSPCFTNAVPNGDFGSVFPAWFPTGPVSVTFPTASVDGVNPSQCMQLVATGTQFRVDQSQSFALTQAVVYEISADVWSDDASWSLDFALTVDGSRQFVLRTRPASGFTRVAGLFVAPTSGNYGIDISVSGLFGTVQLDNVTVRRTDVMITVDGPRTAGQSHQVRVEGPPNSLIAFALSPALLPAGLPLPGWNGEFWIGQPSFWSPAASLDPKGVFTTSLPFPAALAGVTFHWQAVAVNAGTTPSMGCPASIAMPASSGSGGRRR